jgi:signal transduction histidine kinase/ActR/RegA family two-component response regulator
MFPASCFSAFYTSILLYSISQKYNVFGASSANVAKYVFRDVTVPVLVFDTDNRLVLFNDRAPKYFEETYDSLTGLTIENLLQPYEQADNIKEQLAHESLFINEKTGNICKLNNTIVKDEFDDLLYTITFIQDTTEEQRAYEQMAESRLAADAANMAKTNFLANMSHEIRTPMNAIIGMSDIVLQSELDDEETRSHVDDIRSAGLSLLDIINDILDISKIEAGKYDIAHEEYELPSIIHDVSNIVNVKLLESPVKLVTSVDPTIPMYVVGDIVRVRQIVMNLLSNAVKFTNVGSIKFIIGWNNNPVEPELTFTVKDTGIGIKKENLDSIFEAFNRVDTRRNRNIQGTGLGLAISKHLAELMGGNIVAESLYGVGSTFTATVKQGMKEYSPIGDEIAKALEDNRYIMRISERDVEVKKRPWAKILLVDDNRVNLAVAKGLLKPYEMQVDAVLSGADALEKVKEKDYDIVFMDHMMPDMDGIDTTRAIRALGGKYENLTIIALTANAIDAARELFAREGLQDFIAKPIDKRQLNAILDKWLNSPEVYSQAP